MEQNPDNEFRQELDRKIWITKGTRFNAHQRLLNKNSFSIATISFLSLYVLIFTLLQYFLSFTAQQINVISFSAIILSLLILVISLLEASKSYQKKAIQFHNCGRELSSVYSKLHQLSPNSQENISQKLSEIAVEYESALDRCPENHDIVDYDLFRAQHHSDFNLNLFSIFWFYLKGWVKSYFFYLLLIILPPIIIGILLGII